MTPKATPTRHLYVHVPFCARRCSYCDFSIAVRRNVPVDEYLEALSLELASHTGELSLDTLYLGGGTPSTLAGPGIARLIDLVRTRAEFSPDAEITIEANPDDVTREAAQAWRAAGVNRVSLGGQSFDPTVLAWMHRTHDAAQLPRAISVLRAAGIDDVSLDLIFALPSALNRDWPADVERALALAPTHVSLYGLTIEPHTPLGRWHSRGRIAEADEDAYEREFLHAHDALTAAGYDHYEVSNFARPGRRARHNSAYWRGVPYAAVGPSAHRFDGTTRSWNVAPYAEWRDRLGRGESPLGGSEALSQANRAAERVYLGLRTTAGLESSDAELSLARPWVDAGWATLRSPRTIVLTPLGWLRLDALAASLTVAGSY